MHITLSKWQQIQVHISKNYKGKMELKHNLIMLKVTVLDKNCLTLLHSERPKLYAILAFLSAIGLILNNMEKP